MLTETALVCPNLSPDLASKAKLTPVNSKCIECIEDISRIMLFSDMERNTNNDYCPDWLMLLPFKESPAPVLGPATHFDGNSGLEHHQNCGDRSFFS